MFLTEIKAAAVDVVAEGAAAAGRELVFCDNEPVALERRPGRRRGRAGGAGRASASPRARGRGGRRLRDGAADEEA